MHAADAGRGRFHPGRDAFRTERCRGRARMWMWGEPLTADPRVKGMSAESNRQADSTAGPGGACPAASPSSRSCKGTAGLRARHDWSPLSNR